MKIESIYIKSFGCLSDFTLTFDDKVNILEGQNESGKSTIAEFIKFIFYGLGNKSEKGSLSERSKYLSWSGKEASGSLTIDDGNKKYRIERSLVPASRGVVTEELRVIDLETNTAVNNAVPDKQFIGVPEEVFLRSCFVGQADGSRVNGADIHEAIENILFSADEVTNTARAMKKIDEARTMLLYKNKKGGKIFDLQQEQESLYLRLQNAKEANRTIDEKQKSVSDMNVHIAENNSKIEKLESAIRHTEAVRRLHQIDASKQAEEHLSEAENALEKYMKSNSHKEYYPDRQFVDAVTKAVSEYRFAGEELSRAKDDIADIHSEAEKLSRFAECADGAEIMNMVSAKKLKASTLGNFGLVLLILFAAAAAGALIFMMTIKTLGIALAFGAVLLLAGSFICFVARNENKKEIRKAFSGFNVKSESELSVLIEKISEGKAALKSLEDAAKAGQEKAARFEARRKNILDSCRDLLSKWGKPCESEDDLMNASADASVFIDRQSELKNAVERCLAEFKASSAEYTETEENNLRGAIKNDKIKSELSGDDYTEAKREYDFYKKTTSVLIQKAHETEKQLADLRARAESPTELADRIRELSEKEKKLMSCHDAYVLAYEKLDEASKQLRLRIAPRLSDNASVFMRSATGGKYSTLGVDGKLEMQFTDNQSATRDVGYMSAGTQDLAYISLRMALVDLLYGKKQPPLVFDESFARLDDTRLALFMLAVNEYSKQGGQVIMLTSQKRDAKIMDRIGPYSHINL